MTPARIVVKLERALKQAQAARTNLSRASSWAIAHNQHLALGLADQARDLDRAIQSLASLLSILRSQNESEDSQ
jgi:hypothetical protein